METAIVDFLRARLAEDQAAALRACTRMPGHSERRGLALNADSDRAPAVLDAHWDGERWVAAADSELSADPAVELSPRRPAARRRVADISDPETARHIARHDPARVLAEVEAKRQIVEHHGEPHECPEYDVAWDSPCPTLRHLAAVYADHPDYREEWKP